MEQKKLRDELAAGTLRPCYLLFGEERYLVAHFARAIEKTAAAQREEYEGAGVTPEEIHMSMQSVGFFGDENRVLIWRDSGLFTPARKDDAAKMKTYLLQIYTGCVLIFMEREVDKRTKFFKEMGEIGGALECGRQDEGTLAKWAVREAKSHSKQLSPADAGLLLQTCGSDMANLANEIHKLAAYAGESAAITADDIKAIATPTTEARVFDLMKAMCAGQTAKSLRLYADMLALKESPHGILAMIARQLRIMIQAKYGAEQKISPAGVTAKTGLRDFIIREAMSQARRYTMQQLIALHRAALDADISIKSGLMVDHLAVEMLIIKIGEVLP